MSISLVINTRNEASNLAACIESTGDLHDEIVIVDMESEDDTIDIARRYTDRVYAHENVGYVEPARNFAIAQATGDWLLILDADERMQPELIAELRRIAEQDEADVVVMHWRNIFFGHVIRFAGWENDKHARFFKKGYVTFSDAVHAPPVLAGRITEIRDVPHLQVIHHNYRDITQFIQKMNNYTTAEVDKLLEQQVTFSWPRAVFQTLETFRWRYLRRMGFRNGMIGLIVCVLMTFYTLLTWLKLWERQRGQDMA